MRNLSKDRDKKLTFKLFKIKKPRGVEAEQEHSLKKNDKNHKKVIFCNYQYVRS